MSEILEQDTSSAASTQRSTNTLISDSSATIVGWLEERAITDSIASSMSCEAIEGKSPNKSNLLGTNAEALILSYNADGTWHSLLGGEGLQFPENIMIRGRNISVNYFVDGSIRLETVGAINNISPVDGFGGNSTRLDGSKLTLTLDGKDYTDPVIILDGKGGVVTSKKQ